MYTLKDEDHLGYPSLYKLYLAERDVLEYNFANKYLDGWEHWQKLSEASWFKPYIERWRKELELIFRSEALAQILAYSKDSRNPSLAYGATRYLVDKGWIIEKKVQNERGRPSKEEIRKAAEDHFQKNSSILDDFKRLELN